MLSDNLKSCQILFKTARFIAFAKPVGSSDGFMSLATLLY